MPAKVVQISDDDGANYYVLPGNSGEFSDESGALDDTIFGQNFKSGQPNLINWSVKANALYKGFAGYIVDIKKSGSTTTFTAEATTLVSGKTYKITSATKNVWDRTFTPTVYDNAVDHTADVESIDYLLGRVTFKSAYSITGPVTISGKYFPMTVLAKYRSYTLTQTVSPIDDTDIPTAQANNGHMTYEYGLKTVSLEVSGVYASTNGYRASLVARDELVIEINPDGAEESMCRGFFKPTNRSQSGNVGDLEEEKASFTLFVPTDLDTPPFKWLHTSSPLSTSVQKALGAFENETVLKVQYLPDGATGLEGDCIISDVSLSGGLTAMNEFSVNLQGTGEVTVVT